MDIIFLSGLIGSFILVTGAAWPEEKEVEHPAKSLKHWIFAVGRYVAGKGWSMEKEILHPMKSVKNWLLAIGGYIMLVYAILGYQQGSSIFFVILETLPAIASIFMMLNTPDTLDTIVIGISSLALIIWSLFLFEGYNTLFFIFGLTSIGLGYAFQMGTLRRGVALTLGSALIALFSYMEASWIFFWLNTFFALFSGYYVYKKVGKKIIHS